MQEQITCPKCTTPFQVTLPSMVILNNEIVSTVVWPHEEPQTCPNCQQDFQFAIQQIRGISYVYMPVESRKKPEERIIVVPPGAMPH